MKILMINGSMRKGSTYHLAKMFLEKILTKDDLVAEAFLPKDLPEFCRGCSTCIYEGPDKCPDYLIYTKRLTEAIEAADMLLFTTPTYCMHVSGQMKTFLDHYGYLWMIHKPMPDMFFKKAVIFSTSSQSGHNKAIKDIKDSLSYWGFGHIFSCGADVDATDWEEVEEDIKLALDVKTTALAERVRKAFLKKGPSFRTKMLFYTIRFMHKRDMTLPMDKAYWEEKGWLEQERPWKAEEGLKKAEEIAKQLEENIKQRQLEAEQAEQALKEAEQAEKALEETKQAEQTLEEPEQVGQTEQASTETEQTEQAEQVLPEKGQSLNEASPILENVEQSVETESNFPQVEQNFQQSEGEASQVAENGISTEEIIEQVKKLVEEQAEQK